MSGRPADLAPCGLRHVSLAEPFAPIEAASGERAVYTVFWRHGRPAGFHILLAGELPVPAAAVPPLAADTAGPIVAGEDEAATPPPPSGSVSVSVSVVICTRDRPEDLTRCLASLGRCVPPPSEVLVVDNAPRTDATAQAVHAFPNARYVREDRPGLSHARNAGIEAATGEVIAFTDDDVELPEDWIARLATPFTDPEVTCVTGLVLPADLSSEAACLFEFGIGGFGHVLHRRRFDRDYLKTSWWRPPDVWKMGAGANMAMRRAAFAEVGLFDPRLGAGASGCSEDSEFWFRLLRAGHVCVYDPAAVVFHHHRSERPELFRQLRAYARGHVVALFVQFVQDRRPAHLIRAFALMPWYYLKLVFRAIRHRDRDLLAIVRPQFLGCLEGPFHALTWLRRDGPPRLAPSHPSRDRP